MRVGGGSLPLLIITDADEKNEGHRRPPKNQEVLQRYFPPKIILDMTDRHHRWTDKTVPA